MTQISAASSSAPPLIQIAPHWRHIKGCVLGLRSPSIQGRLSIASEAAAPLLQILTALTELTGETLTASAEDNDQKRCTEHLASAVGALQRYAGIYVGFLHHSTALQDGQTLLTLPIDTVDATRLAMGRLVRLVNFLGRAHPNTDAAATVATWFSDVTTELAGLANPRINVFMLRQAADDLGIPSLRLGQEHEIFGAGRYARWFDSTLTDRTPAIGVRIAKNKFKTAAMLRSAGLPGSDHHLVHSLEQARSAADALGYPVVVKPNNQDRGLGVHADLRTPEELEIAFAESSTHSSDILVEKWVAGDTHRLTVFQDQVIRVVRRQAGGVTGDGVTTVLGLVSQRAQSPEFQRRAARSGRPLLALDAEALALLAREGLDANSVPLPGHFIRLRRKDNISAGGTNQTCDLTTVHPDNLQLARDTARLLRLDFAGIDLITQDITRSWIENNALICEVNAQPQLRAGGDRSVYVSIFQSMFGGTFHIPCDATLLHPGSRVESDLACRLSLKKPGLMVSAPGGLWRDGRRITAGFSSGHQAAVAALARTDCEGLHALLPAEEVRANGLPTFGWRRCDLQEPPAGHAWAPAQIHALRGLVGSYFEEFAT